ncbi:hypothetical protein BDF21DRAFT_243321 [Thamnidium elegans]|nr:hypothetical protein BDF21DRAFT_243321 [Thamnidium elegans]
MEELGNKKFTTTCITNENKISQTCVYCFRLLSLPRQKVMVKGKMIQKNINGAFICYKQETVFQLCLSIYPI